MTISHIYLMKLFFQNSSQGSTTWGQIQTLAKKLKAFDNIEIHKSHFKTFIDSLLQYIELALGFISNSQDMEYKRQKQYASRLLGFIPVSCLNRY